MESIGHRIDVIKVDVEADPDGNVSMWTPSVLTIKLQKGKFLFGGRFLATVT